jgi:type IV pilus assembly protein PilV
MLSFHSRRNKGFTLIEVLISMIILAIGLLGLASLQIIALRESQDAYTMQQAILLATDMQARMRSNSGIDWLTISPNTSDTCIKSNACTKAQLASNDYGEWTRNAQKNLPANATVKIQLSSSINKAPCVSSTPKSLCLVTTWTRANAKKSGVFSQNATFYLEIIPS